MQTTSKQRAQRIDPRYHQAVAPWIRSKRWYALAGVVVGVAVGCWLMSPMGRSAVSTGGLSRAHQAWNETGCEKCHQEFVPIRTDAWNGHHPEFIRQNNQACNACHPVPAHHAATTRPDVLEHQACSQCHREHLGIQASLLSVEDSLCAQCHASIQSYASASTLARTNVTDFNKDHPTFGLESMEKDPSAFKFSHIQHMRPGQPKTPGDATAKHLDQLPAEDRLRYRADPATQLVTLDCRDCHSPDIAASDGSASPDQRRFQPVSFERHCAACHGLDGIPHGLDRERTQAAIEARLPVELFTYFQERGDLSKIDPQEIAEKEQRIRALASDAASGCLKCHFAAPADATSIVAQGPIRQAWLRDGTFLHGAHGMVSCERCHAQAYLRHDRTIDSLRESDEIMIPGRDSCRECHVQDPGERMQLSGLHPHTATAHCTDCHRFHVDAIPGERGPHVPN